MKLLLAVFLFFVSLPSLSDELARTETVTIESYQFEFEQVGSGKALVETTGEESEGISYHSVTLNYKLKQDNIVESPTLLASINKKAEEKCKEVAGSTQEGEIISKTRTVAPWLITGKYICALK
jgi:hypothetical protein